MPKQPHVDRANTLDDGPNLDINAPHYDYSVYLVDEIVDGADLDWVLREYYLRIFYNELMDWHTDPKDWPETCDFETFQQWFEVRVSSMVIDLCEGKIRTEKYEG